MIVWNFQRESRSQIYYDSTFFMFLEALSVQLLTTTKCSIVQIGDKSIKLSVITSRVVNRDIEPSAILNFYRVP